ncbi:uncharacterized protein LOC129805185 [Phlebotomus papatasi]|uniref:uncharacterized protein LOC129805185 n=1 Tax=Phlebotomus papatasi TaxID=29031 RepID=UPI0024845796|nr:uncharacterized protein LOC129805185 [Phlebotomus papatasi]
MILYQPEFCNSTHGPWRSFEGFRKALDTDGASDVRWRVWSNRSNLKKPLISGARGVRYLEGICMKFSRVLHIFLMCNFLLKMEFPCISRQCLIQVDAQKSEHVIVFRDSGKLFPGTQRPLVCSANPTAKLRHRRTPQMPQSDVKSVTVSGNRQILPMLLICYLDRKNSLM